MSNRMMLLAAVGAQAIASAGLGATPGDMPLRFTQNQPAPERPALLLSAVNDARAWPDGLVLDVAPVDVARLARQDADLDHIPGMPARIGVVNSVAPDGAPMALGGAWGQWTPVNGMNVWRARLRSAGALRVRLHLSNVTLPAGASLTVTGADGQAWNAGNAQDAGLDEGNGFWTPSIFGEGVNIEYAAPAGVQGAALPTGVIDALTHIYRDGAAGGTGGAQQARDAAPAAGGSDDASSCNINVLCEARAAAVRLGVARIELIDSGQAYLCTGSFLNDGDTTTETPWFLTANHCVDNQTVALTVEAFFGYTAKSCADPTTPSLSTLAHITGADFIAGVSDVDGTDTTLLRFKSAPPSGTALLGWSLTRPAPTAAGSGALMWVHHPHGSYQRVSFGDLTIAPSPRCEDTPDADYFYASQARGTTEPGSSGSPIFNGDGKIVGVLSALCGNSDLPCQPAGFSVIFGDFGRTFSTLKLAGYLGTSASTGTGSGGTGGGGATDDQYEPNNTLVKAAKLPPADATYNLQLLDDHDFFYVMVDRIAVLDISATMKTPGSTLSMKVTLGKLNVSGNLGPTAAADASFRVRPGRYNIEIDRPKGTAGGAYTLAFAYSTASDLNADGKVDINDVIDVLTGFGQRCKSTSAGCPDVNGDLVVNILDLKQVLEEFGYTRKNYSVKAWSDAMTTLYDGQVLDDITRTKLQQRNDLLRLKAVPVKP